MQLQINNNKLSIADISNTKSKSETWFWNKSINKIDSNSEKERKRDKKKEKDKNNELNPKTEKFKTKWLVSSEIKINKIKKKKINFIRRIQIV